MNIKTGYYIDGRKILHILDNNDDYEEVARIYPKFFKKPYKKQKQTLRLLIWWSIKHYLKILTKN